MKLLIVQGIQGDEGDWRGQRGQEGSERMRGIRRDEGEFRMKYLILNTVWNDGIDVQYSLE